MTKETERKIASVTFTYEDVIHTVDSADFDDEHLLIFMEGPALLTVTTPSGDLKTCFNLSNPKLDRFDVKFFPQDETPKIQLVSKV